MSESGPSAGSLGDATVVEGAGASIPGHDGPGPDPGVVLGRYVVIEHVASGGMGSVLRAYDPRLRREVALKRVRAGGRDPAGRQRLVREARAMARLSHPNTVAVYDVEPQDGDVYFAMEYLPGGTLKEWLQAEPRDFEAIVAVMRQAGEGLAAAHRADLVHRDFKPANVLVADDGRVKVTDFGLAKPAHSIERTPSGPVAVVDVDELTMAGTVMGTPRYMAPEQHSGDDADARADQYAWCVTLWEALAGAPPFSGKTMQALHDEKVAGPPPWPRGRTIPASVLAAMRRGLSVDPSARFPSMTALLAAVDGWRTRARRRRVALAVVGVAAGIGSIVGWQAWQRHRAVAACEAAGAEVAQLWPGQREAMVEGLRRAGPDTADATAERASPWLDAWAQSWQRARTDVCLASEVTRTLGPELRPRALGCLDASRIKVRTVLQAVAQGQPEAARGVVAAFAAPMELDACTDPERLTQTPWPAVEQSEEVAALRASLAEASGLRLAGRYEDGRARTQQVLDAAQALDFAPLSVEAELSLGTLLELQGEYAAAEEHERAAFFGAASVGMDRVALEAAARLVFTVGLRQARHAEGLDWAEHARVYVTRLGETGRLSSANLFNNEAAVRRTRSERDEALALHEKALAIREQVLGPEHPDVATSLSNLALVVADTGDYARARELHERALAIRQATLGPDHPNVASSLDNVAGVARALGDYETALAMHERALAVWERAMGPDHPAVAVCLTGLSIVRLRLEDEPGATADAERALRIREQQLGPDHPDLGMTLDVLATLRWSAGRRDDAIALNERALEIRRKAYGPEHPHVGASLVNLAGQYEALGKHAEAKARYEEALSIFEQAEDGHDPHLVEVVSGLADVALATGDTETARAYLPRLREILAAGNLEPYKIAELEFQVAQIEWSGGEPAVARAAAQRALDGYVTLGIRDEQAAEVRAWLDAHPGS